MATATWTVLDRIESARAAMIARAPFWGSLAARMTLVEDPGCQTAWTDGTRMGYNPRFIETLTDRKLEGLIAHETAHNAFGHPWRRGWRDNRQWNVAADYVINGVLLAAGFELPDGGLVDPKWDGHFEEWVYDRLGDAPQPQPQPQPTGGTGKAEDDGEGEGGAAGGDDPGEGDEQEGEGSGEGDPGDEEGKGDPGGCGEVRDAPAPSESEGEGEGEGGGKDLTEDGWKDAVGHALAVAQGQGTIGGGLAERLAEAARRPTDWVEQLLQFAQQQAKREYVWTRKSRRTPEPFFMPALGGQSCGPLAVGFDCSGSCDTVLQRQFIQALQAMLDTVNPESLTVYVCNTRVMATHVFAPGDTVEFDAGYGGGTDFRPVFDAIEQSDEPMPEALIYLTDLWGSFPAIAPDYPVVWAVYNGGTHQPFGERIDVQ